MDNPDRGEGTGRSFGKGTLFGTNRAVLAIVIVAIVAPLAGAGEGLSSAVSRLDLVPAEGRNNN
jgi:hypothetical protein